jgi:glycosidase
METNDYFCAPIAARHGVRFAFGVLFAVALIAAPLVSCASSAAPGGRRAAIDPARATYGLAPLERKAALPNEGVYYELFVRSFADSNGDGIGDFRGLVAKLDYLNDGDDGTTTDLGVTGIWLMPIFPSQSYHGYDVDDYYAVNPDYGTMEDFRAFLAAAKKRGISVIIDLPLNHSSVYTEWFQNSKDPASPYRSWYRWASADDGRFNLNQKIWGHNVWNRVKDSYYAGIFDSGMPDFDLSNPDVRAEMKKIMKFWLDAGVSGFRFDAAGHVFNAAKLPSGTNGQEDAVAFWKEMVGYVRSVRPDAYTVGEVWDATSTRATYMKGLYSSFHFDLGTRIVDAIRSGEAGDNNIANSLYAAYQTYAAANPEYVDAPFLTNHDQNRIAGMLRGDPAQLKLAASIYLLAEGVPFVYYGEEIGLMGAKPDEQLRTPLLWDEPGKDRLQTTWAESRYNKKTIPVAAQASDRDSVLSHYKRLARVRTGHPALYAGRLTPLATGNAAILSWTMSAPAETAFVIHNLSAESVTVALPADVSSMTLAFATYAATSVANGTITLPARGSAILSASK